MLIKKSDEFWNERNGYNYRAIRPHFDDFYCEASDEFDETLGEFVNYKPCYLTRNELKHLVGAKDFQFEQ